MARKFDSTVAWDHFDELAARHKIKVRPCSSRKKAIAHVATRQVWVPPQRALIDYMLGLHELGHVVSTEARRHQRWYAELETREHEVCCEAAAWAWAVDNMHPAMLRLMTQADWHHVADFFSTYLSHNAGKRRRD